MATNDTHPAVTADSGPLPGPGLTLAPVSSLTFQPACHLPAGERYRAQPLLDPLLWRAGLGGHVAATPADTALRAPPTSKTLQIDAESKIGRSVGRRQHPAELLRSRVLARCRG